MLNTLLEIKKIPFYLILCSCTFLSGMANAQLSTTVTKIGDTTARITDSAQTYSYTRKYSVDRKHQSQTYWSRIYDGNARTSFDNNLNQGPGVYEFRVRYERMYPYTSTPTYSNWEVFGSVTVTSSVPGIPPSFTSTEYTSYDGTYRLNWGASSGATYYQWREKLSTSPNWPGFTSSGTGRSLNRTKNSGTYNYQVRACSAQGCSSVRSLNVNVVKNISPTITRSESTSTDSTYTLNWTAGRINGQTPKNVWIYEGSTFVPVYLTQQNGTVIVNHKPLTRTKTSQGTWTYYTRACINVSYGYGGIPNAPSGTCLNSSSTTVAVNYPTPGKVGTLTLGDSEGTYDTDGRIDLSWGAISNTTKYEIRYGKTGASKTTINNAASRSRSFTGLADGTWEFETRACNSVNECGGWSTKASKVVLRKPGVPSSFTSTESPSYDGTYTLNWGTSSNQVARYEWRERLSSASWPSFTNAGGGRSVGRSKNNGTYNYQVRACNAAGCSGVRSLNVTVDKNIAPTITRSEATSTDSAYTLNWTAGRINGQTPKHVWIYEGSSPIPVYLTQNTGAVVTNTKPLTRTKTTQGSWNYYTRACVNVSYGQGGVPYAPSGTCVNSGTTTVAVNFPTPGKVGTLALGDSEGTYDTDGRIDVSWGAIANVSRYDIRYGKVGASKTTVNNAAARSKSFTGLADGTWEFETRACNSVNECGGWSTKASKVVLRKPGVPSSFTSTESPSYDGTYTLNWGTSSNQVARYEWRERLSSASWPSFTNAGGGRSVGRSKNNGTYNYQVRACNAAGCSGVRSLNVTVDKNIAPTITRSEATSTDSAYTLNWTAGRINGQTPKHVWIYEGSSPIPVYLTQNTGAVVTNTKPLTRTKTTQGSWNYYTRACVNVSYGQGGVPYAPSGTCVNSGTTTVAVNFPTPGKVGTLALGDSEGTYDTDGRIDVSWGAIANVSRYDIRYGKVGASKTTVNNAAARSKSFTGLADGTWEFETRACNSVNECGAWSNKSSKEVRLLPGVPTNFAISQANSPTGSYSISWSKPSGVVNTYQWRTRTNSGSWSSVTTQTSLSKSFEQVTEATFGYQVRACRSGGICSGFTSEVATAVDFPIPEKLGLPAIGDSEGYIDRDGRMEITWSGVSYANTFDLRYGLAGSSKSTQSGLSRAYSSLSLGDGIWEFEVRACNLVGECGAWSDVALKEALVPPQIPQNLVISEQPSFDGTYTLSWSNSSGVVNTYEWREKRGNGSWSSVTSQTSRTRSFNKSTEDTYAYQVRACREKGVCSEYSEIAATSVVRSVAGLSSGNASVYTPQTTSVKVISSDQLDEDVLQISPPNNSGISVNKFGRFELVGKPLLIDNSASGETGSNPTTIIIIANNIILENTIDVVGSSADLVFLSESNNGKIDCSGCAINNSYRTTFGVVNGISGLSQSSTSLGNLKAGSAGVVKIEDMRASGLLAFDVLAASVVTVGNLDFNQRARVSNDGSLTVSSIGSLKLGTTSLNFMTGVHTWNYESQTVMDYDLSNRWSAFSGSINAVGVRYSLAGKTTVGTQIDTGIDRLVSVMYRGKERISAENIQIFHFAENDLILSNSQLITSGDVSINSMDDITISPTTAIEANSIGIVAKNTLVQEGRIDGKYAFADAKRIINEGHLHASSRIDLLGVDSIVNQYGGDIETDVLRMQADQNTNGFIRNGSRTPYRSDSTQLIPIDDGLFVDSDHVKIGTFYNANIDDVSFNGKTKPAKTSAHIRARSIEVKTHAFENINPYYEVVDGNGLVTMKRELQDQVSTVAEDYLGVDASKYIVNSSAFIGVQSATGNLHLSTDVLTNERYRVLNKLDVSRYTEQEINQYYSGISVDIDGEIVRTKVATYSPPGVMFSMGNFEAEATGLFLNSIGYLEVFGDARFQTNQLVDAGIAHQQSIREASVTTYRGTMCDPCTFSGQSSAISNPEQMDSLFYINGNALASQAYSSVIVDYSPFRGYIARAVNNIVAADSEFSQRTIDDVSLPPNTSAQSSSSYFVPAYSYANLGFTSDLGHSIDGENDTLTINLTEVTSYDRTTDYSGANGGSSDSVYTERINRPHVVEKEYSIFDTLKNVYNQLSGWFDDVLNEFKWWN